MPSGFWGSIVTGYAPQFDLGTASAPGPGFMPFLAGIVWSFFALVTFLQALFNRSEEGERIWADVSSPKLTFILIALLLYAFVVGNDRVFNQHLSPDFRLDPFRRTPTLAGPVFGERV